MIKNKKKQKQKKNEEIKKKICIIMQGHSNLSIKRGMQQNDFRSI